MSSIKRNTRIIAQWKTVISILLFILAFFNLEIPESRSNVRPDIITQEILPLDIFNAEATDFRNFSAKTNPPTSPFYPGHPVNPDQNDPLSGHCYFKESYRLFAERGQGIAYLAFTGVSISYPDISHVTFYHFPFIFISSRTGKSTRIRPPPII